MQRETEHLDEAQRLIGSLNPQMPLDERAYLLQLATARAIVDIAWSLRALSGLRP